MTLTLACIHTRPHHATGFDTERAADLDVLHVAQLDGRQGCSHAMVMAPSLPKLQRQNEGERRKGGDGAHSRIQ